MSEELKSTQIVYGENVLMMRVDDCLIFGNKNALRSLAEKLTELPSAEPQPKWTPVTEALPEEDIDVLLQFPHNMGVGYQENGFWCIVTCDDLYSGLDEEDEKPIAWMPLPEPYKGVTNE